METTMRPQPKTFTEFNDAVLEWGKAAAKRAARHEARLRVRQAKQANVALYNLGRTYHDGVPLNEVNDILTQAGFNRLDAFMVCGREGRLHEDVGNNRWLSLTWYKMESGRYEVVAYVS
jgi:hypothetical protein